MELEKIEIAKLISDPANVRKHGERNIQTIVASLHRFGQQKPIVIDKHNVVRAGNGTLEAARSMGWTHLNCVRTSLEGGDAVAYSIADNRTAELAEWDDDLLAAQLNGLLTEDEAMFEAAGFDEDELAELLKESDDQLIDVTEDEVPEPPVDPITKPGDLWLLGEHRLLCGDSTKAEDVERLMAGAKADMCFTSPPYGQQRDYTEEGKAKVADWDGLMRGVFGNLPMTDAGQVLVNLGLIHRDGEWIPYWDAWIEWMREQGWRRFGWYVWDKLCALPGDHNGRLGPAHEFIWHFCKQPTQPEKWIETINAGRVVRGHNRQKDGSLSKQTGWGKAVQSHRIHDSVWRCGAQKGTDNPHPAMMPVALAEIAMRSWPGIAYEPFCGSGTTLIAAEQLGRTCYGMEISPQYCDVIVKRWENLTGEKAVCQSATPD
jgi:DNA modification methylase